MIDATQGIQPTHVEIADIKLLAMIFRAVRVKRVPVAIDDVGGVIVAICVINNNIVMNQRNRWWTPKLFVRLYCSLLLLTSSAFLRLRELAPP